MASRKAPPFHSSPFRTINQRLILHTIEAIFTQFCLDNTKAQFNEVTTFIEKLDNIEEGKGIVAAKIATGKISYANFSLSTLKACKSILIDDKLPRLFSVSDFETEWEASVRQYRTSLLTSPKETFADLIKANTSDAVRHLDVGNIDKHTAARISVACDEVFFNTLWREALKCKIRQSVDRDILRGTLLGLLSDADQDENGGRALTNNFVEAAASPIYRLLQNPMQILHIYYEETRFGDLTARCIED